MAKIRRTAVRPGAATKDYLESNSRSGNVAGAVTPDLQPKGVTGQAPRIGAPAKKQHNDRTERLRFAPPAARTACHDFALCRLLRRRPPDIGANLFSRSSRAAVPLAFSAGPPQPRQAGRCLAPRKRPAGERARPERRCYAGAFRPQDSTDGAGLHP